MTLLDAKTEVHWRDNNKEWYEEKGYVWTKNGDVFLVNTEDVIKGSKKEIRILCDYCGIEFHRKFAVWYNSATSSPIKKDACSKCRGLKTKESNLLVHGVTNIMHIDAHKQKIKETNLEKYGVTSPLQNKEILAKVQQTNIERYGVPVPAKNAVVAEKMKQTNLERYGATTYMNSEEGSIIVKNSIMERYGVENVSQSDEIKAKKNATMYKNSSTPTSSQQFHIHSILGGELNYPFGRSSLDIAFPEDLIYLEYDGGGHNLDVKLGQISQQEFDKKEQRRSFFLKDNGWREIRIISDEDKLPSDSIIADFVDIVKHFINSGKWFSAHWNIDEDFVKVNYKHIYSFSDFLSKYDIKEVV